MSNSPKIIEAHEKLEECLELSINEIQKAMDRES